MTWFPVTFIQNEDPEAKRCCMAPKAINIVGDFREYSDEKFFAVAKQAVFYRWMHEPI